jgi:hypothetical protein
MKSTMILVGGAKDGWETEISPQDRPDVFYVVPYEDEAKISACKSPRAKLEMRDRLARLAYRFDPDQSSANRFLMRRTPELDRVTQR